MDRQVEEKQTEAEKQRGNGSAHLMCRTSLWGVAGLLGCAYFTWVSFGRVAHNELEWPHDAWTAVTYVVWIVLLGALAIDTHCLRERFFFGILLVNFFVGFVLTLWRGIPGAEVRAARLATGALWALGAFASLTTVGKSQK